MLFHLSQELSNILLNEQKREILYWKLMENEKEDQNENQENNNEMMNNSNMIGGKEGDNIYMI